MHVLEHTDHLEALYLSPGVRGTRCSKLPPVTRLELEALAARGLCPVLTFPSFPGLEHHLNEQVGLTWRQTDTPEDWIRVLSLAHCALRLASVPQAPAELLALEAQLRAPDHAFKLVLTDLAMLQNTPPASLLASFVASLTRPGSPPLIAVCEERAFATLLEHHPGLRGRFAEVQLEPAAEAEPLLLALNELACQPCSPLERRGPKHPAPLEDLLPEQPHLQDACRQLIGQLVVPPGVDRPAPLSVLCTGAQGAGWDLLIERSIEASGLPQSGLRRISLREHAAEGLERWLFGAPDHTEPARRAGKLAQWRQRHRDMLLAIEDLELAPSRLLDRLTMLLETGCFTDGMDRVHRCSTWVVLLWDGSAAARYRPHWLGHPDSGALKLLEKELQWLQQQHLGERLLRACDQVLWFRPWTRETLQLEATAQLERQTSLLSAQLPSCVLHFERETHRWLAVYGVDPLTGTHALARRLHGELIPGIFQALRRDQEKLSGSASRGLTPPHPDSDPSPADLPVVVGLRRGRLEARVQPRAASAQPNVVPFRRQAGHPDANLLKSQADRLLRAALRVQATELERRAERDRLLERLRDPSLWATPECAALLELFQAVELSLVVGELHMTPLLHLKEARDASDSGPASLATLEQAIDSAREALNRLEARENEEGRALWLVLSPADPSQPVGRWLIELAGMELAWCKRQGLRAEVVGYELIRSELCRVAIRVEGEGAQALLAMEEGIHRLFHPQGQGLQARLELIDQGPRPSAVRTDLALLKRGPGHFGLEPTFRARLELRGRRQIMDFVGCDRETLSHLLHDLEDAWAEPSELPALVRSYGEERGGVRDPRTGVFVSQLKEVLSGRLEGFLEGWEEQD